jgi:transposase-like protein
MQNHEARFLRRRIAARDRGRGKRYPPELREQVTQWVQRQVAAGRTIRATADAIGVDPETARLWIRSTPKTRKRPVVVPVAVVSPANPPSTLSVVSPTGFRVDGLAIEAAAALLRALI